MSDPLATYLHDHLAGSNFAINLLQAMREGKIKSPGREFVEPLLAEIEQDRQSLYRLIEKIPSSPGAVKQMAAWVGEKAHRAKLLMNGKQEFEEFEALEFLALGILGKRALWSALQLAARLDARLRELDYEQLIARAEAQYAAVEDRRLAAAAATFATSDA